jgi:hypothetical protein
MKLSMPKLIKYWKSDWKRCFIKTNAYTKKEDKSQNNIVLYLKKLEKQQQTIPKVVEGKK